MLMRLAAKRLSSHSLISLGDFIADVCTTHSASYGCQVLAVAATHLIAQQSAEHCANANSDGAILRNGCRLRVGRSRGILLSRLRLRNVD